MDRRQVLVGASALAASTVVAHALPEQGYCINPWRQARAGDAMVKMGDVLLVGFVSQYGWNPLPPGGWNIDDSWLEVWTSDGRYITTEYACNQSSVHALRSALTRGIKARKSKRESCYAVYQPARLDWAATAMIESSKSETGFEFAVREGEVIVLPLQTPIPLIGENCIS